MRARLFVARKKNATATVSEIHIQSVELVKETSMPPIVRGTSGTISNCSIGPAAICLNMSSAPLGRRRWSPASG